MNIRLIALLAALSLSLAAPCAAAQEAGNDESSGWEHSLVIYLLGPTIEGTVGIGPIDGDMKIDPSDVFDSLEMGFLGGWVAEKDG